MEKSIEGIQALIQTLAKAKIAHYPPDVVVKARRTMHGLALKFGPNPDRHPPDETITAQFLSLAPWPRLERLLQDLMIERREVGENDGWFVAVALQRLHGVQWSELREHRAQLRAVPAPRAAAAVQGGLEFPAPDDRAEGREFAAGLVDQLKRAKGGKR